MNREKVYLGQHEGRESGALRGGTVVSLRKCDHKDMEVLS